MALTPRLAQGPRLGSIPLPERGPSIAEGVGAVVDAVANAQELDRQATQREEQVAHELALREQADRRSTQISQGIVAWEEWRVAFERQRETLREAPDLTSYREEADKAWRASSEEFLASLPPDEEVRRHFTAPLARMGATYARADDEWLGNQKAALDARALTDMANGHAIEAMNGYRKADEIAARRATFLEFLATKRLDPRRQALAVDAYERAIRGAVLDGAENAGDTATLDALAADVDFMAPLGKDATDGARDRSAALKRAQAAAAEAEVAAKRESAQDSLDTVEATIAVGGIVAQKDADAAIAAARAAGVEESKIIKVQGVLKTQAVNREFGPQADPDGSKTRARLMQLNNLGRPLTSEEKMDYDRLLAIQGKRRESDAALLKPMAGKSPAGDLQVFGELDKRTRDERFAVAEEVRPGMGYFGLLSGATRQAAVEGYYDLKANADLIRVKPGKQGGMTDPTKDAIRAHLGIVADQMPEAALEGYRGVANAIYVKLQKDAGSRGWDPALYRHAINKAMGARKGADGQWRGGMGLVQNRHVWLPDWASAREVENQIARNPFAMATYDGTRPAAKADILKNFTPVLDEGGGPGEPVYYRFVDAAGKELTRKGTRERYRMMIAPGAR